MSKHEDNADVRVVRPVDGSILGSKEADLVPLPITDDRDFDYMDPRLKAEADLVIKLDWRNIDRIQEDFKGVAKTW